MIGAKKRRGSKKLDSVNQEQKTTIIIMLGPLLDKLIRFAHFVVDVFGKRKRKTQTFLEQCCTV